MLWINCVKTSNAQNMAVASVSSDPGVSDIQLSASFSCLWFDVNYLPAMKMLRTLMY